MDIATSFVILGLAAVGIGCVLAAAFYVRRAWEASFQEGIASIFCLVIGTVSYALAKREHVRFGLDSPLDLLTGRDATWFCLFITVGAACGFYSVEVLNRRSPRNYRLILILMCWATVVVGEMLFALMSAKGEKKALVFGAAFVLASCVVAVIRIPVRRNVMASDEDEEETGEVRRSASEESQRRREPKAPPGGTEGAPPF